MSMLKYLYFLAICFVINSSNAQTVEWVYLETDAVSDNCTSTTDCSTNSLCFGLQYTPGVSGTATSYTLGFTGTCINDDVPNIVASSCTMTDNTSIIDGCMGAGLYLLQASGNNGNTSITSGQPIILHQICIDLGVDGISTIEEEMTTGLSISIDSVGTGNPITEIPTFGGFEANTDFCMTVSCVDTTVCSIDFGKQSSLTFDTLMGGNIAESSSLINSIPGPQSFDLYDEINELCQVAGGLDDVTFTFQTINTVDLNDLGLIDTLSGTEHFLIQTADGIVGNIPFGTSADSESSTGDSRGYSITVEFASHIGIVADQITVVLSGMNSAGSVFESARLTFLGNGLNPYGTSSYLGLFNDTTDLSGNCMVTQKIIPWDTLGVGSVLFQDTSTVDLLDPCNPILGNMTQDTVFVNARIDAGLDSAAVVRGFTLTVLGEDVAAPLTLDDGTGSDDNFLANANTSTNESLQSSLLGYNIKGCVFADIVLAVDLLDFSVRRSGQESIIEWSTNRAVNHNYFSVEWSSDGKYFEEIERQFGNGDAESRVDYSYIHKNPGPGINYYRLNAVDLDGSYSYSDIKKLKFEGVYPKEVLLYPNPANGKVNILMPESTESDLQINIYSIQGVPINQYIIKSGMRSADIDISNFVNGQYFLKIGSVVRKFVVVN